MFFPIGSDSGRLAVKSKSYVFSLMPVENNEKLAPGLVLVNFGFCPILNKYSFISC